MNNHPYTILQNLPLIKIVPALFSPEECQQIIDYSHDQLKPSEVVRHESGEVVVDYTIRSASTAFVPYDADISKFIFSKVSNCLDINSNRFEKVAITHYATGQQFVLHPDYFSTDPASTSTASRCKTGGNRVSTVIVYLNTVEEGGETHFPWAGKFIKPQQGNLVYFEYNYDNPALNVRTQHASLPVITGEKYIFTIWIREVDIFTECPTFKNFAAESAYLEYLTSGEYTLDCGPDYDRQTLSIELPVNTDPRNMIAVPFTGGMDSSLLLYLLGALNNTQTIPYHIKPICVYEGDLKNWKSLENHDNVDTMANLIREKIGGNIRHPSFIPMADGTTIADTILGFCKKATGDSFLNNSLKFFNPCLIYSGENALPDDNDTRWNNIHWARIRSNSDKWIQPFYNLKKYHILDAIIQLELEDILHFTEKCRHNHTSLDEVCHYTICNERRWAFTKLGLDDLGNKYFINTGDK